MPLPRLMVPALLQFGVVLAVGAALGGVVYVGVLHLLMPDLLPQLRQLAFPRATSESPEEPGTPEDAGVPAAPGVPVAGARTDG